MESKVVTSAETHGNRSAPTPGAQRGAKFYLVAAAVLIGLVVVSFAPTLYLRSLFNARDSSGSLDLPFHLFVHGVVISLWFVLLLAQSMLVRARRTDLHKRFGIAGVFLAAFALITSAITTVRAVPRFTAAGVDPSLQAIVVTGDLVAMLTFAAFVIAAVVWRRSAPTHKRCMLLASFALIGPGILGGDRPITMLQHYIPIPLPVVLLCMTF